MPVSAFFTAPWLLVTLIAPAALVWRAVRSRTSTAGFTAPSSTLFDDVPVTFRERLARLPLLLRVIALALVSLALSGLHVVSVLPQLPARDVALVFDVSGSMLAEDAKPSRLGAAKALAERLVAHAPRDHFAVLSFAEQAITDCPLTDDHAAVLDAIRLVEHRPSESGTALGRGLAAAIRTMMTGDQRVRRIVLLTDGAENGGELAPLDAARLASSRGIVLDTVGVGSAGGAVPYPTIYGTLDVRLDLDEGALLGLASSGGGHYRRLDDHLPIAAFDDDLRAGESRSNDSAARRETDLLPACLLLAVVALVTEAVLRTSVLRMYA